MLHNSHHHKMSNIKDVKLFWRGFEVATGSAGSVADSSIARASLKNRRAPKSSVGTRSGSGLNQACRRALESIGAVGGELQKLKFLHVFVDGQNWADYSCIC